MGEVKITTLSDREWCIVTNPIDADGKPQWGMKEVRQGRTSFFLHPGEDLETGIKKVYILGEQEALLIRVEETFTEGTGANVITRQPGDLWMITGPRDYIPPVELEVLEKLQAIPLDKNEGIYVRDVQSGELKLVNGPQAYMLSPFQGQLAVNLAQQEVEAARIRHEAEMAQLRARQETELAHQQTLNNLEIEKARQMAEITATEFQQKVEALGAETIRAIAQAGP
ncbi:MULTISPECIES: hypothetical protein [Okeania]|uniref:hypothetical protein n=1 Tax=Okeania TaxID=1458928 RepID=UPI001F00BBBC|nr:MULTISPECIES: hypothetical protein [Okeania]